MIDAALRDTKDRESRPRHVLDRRERRHHADRLRRCTRSRAASSTFDKVIKAQARAERRPESGTAEREDGAGRGPSPSRSQPGQSRHGSRIASQSARPQPRSDVVREFISQVRADRRPADRCRSYYGDPGPARRRQPRRGSATTSSTGLSNGAIWALIALGYTLVYGIIELINFAHGEVFMIGSFVAVGALRRRSASRSTTGTARPRRRPARRADRLRWSSCGSLNVMIERVAYRPLRNAPKLAPLITAVGFSLHPAERRPPVARRLAARASRT